jgi:hypothetical protein
MRLFRGLLGVTLFGSLGIAGCQFEKNIDDTKKWTLKPTQPIAYYHNDTGTNQKRKIKITMKAFPSGSSVAVAAVLKDDFEAAKDAMKKGGEPPKYFASHAGGDNIQFEEFTIDGHTPFSVILLLRSDETVEVELKVKSR